MSISRPPSRSGSRYGKDIKKIVEASQKSLDIRKGPVFAVDLIESDESGHQVSNFVFVFNTLSTLTSS